MRCQRQCRRAAQGTITDICRATRPATRGFSTTGRKQAMTPGRFAAVQPDSLELGQVRGHQSKRCTNSNSGSDHAKTSQSCRGSNPPSHCGAPRAGEIGGRFVGPQMRQYCPLRDLSVLCVRCPLDSGRSKPRPDRRVCAEPPLDQSGLSGSSWGRKSHVQALSRLTAANLRSCQGGGLRGATERLGEMAAALAEGEPDIEMGANRVPPSTAGTSPTSTIRPRNLSILGPFWPLVVL